MKPGLSSHAPLPPPSAGAGTLRSGGGRDEVPPEGQRDAGGLSSRRAVSGSGAPLSRSRLMPGRPCPAERGGRARFGVGDADMPPIASRPA